MTDTKTKHQEMIRRTKAQRAVRVRGEQDDQEPLVSERKIEQLRSMKDRFIRESESLSEAQRATLRELAHQFFETFLMEYSNKQSIFVPMDKLAYADPTLAYEAYMRSLDKYYFLDDDGMITLSIKSIFHELAYLTGNNEFITEGDKL